MERFMPELDKVMVFVYPMGMIAGVIAALMGFGVVSSGAPDKGGEEALRKRLKMLKWLGPLLFVGNLCLFFRSVLIWR
jgi:lysophospholipid acyltransferase (LPLAT)-like uncharacterized protein